MNVDADLENFEITFTAASGEPYKRWDEEKEEFYYERLVITDEAVDLNRLNNGASILKNHDPDHILGTITRAWIEDGKVVVRARFCKNSPEAQQIFRDIVDGTMKNVSIGYFPKTVVPTIEDGINYRDLTRWEAFEVSVAVGVPADPTVGFYRSISKKENKMNEDELKKNEVDTAAEEEKNKNTPPCADCLRNQTVQNAEKTEQKNEQAAVATDEQVRAAVRQLIGDAGGSVRSFNTPKKSSTPQKYSLTRAFQSLLDPKVGQYEREVSDGLMRAAGMTANSRSGIMLSFRDFTGAEGSGKGLIGTDHRADLFVRMLRTRMGVKKATVISGLTGNADIPVQTAMDEAGIGAINSAASDVDLTVDGLVLSPKKFSGSVKIGEDLLAQGNPDAIAIVIDELQAQIARKLDCAILTGSASPKISGLNGTTGVNTVTVEDMNNITWRDVTAMYGKVADYEIEDGDLEWVMKGATKATLMGISKDAGSGRYLLEDNKMVGFNTNICGKLSLDDLYLGVWKNVIIGQWGGLQVKIDDVTGIKEGSVTIVAKLLADVVITNPAAFVKRVSA